MSVYRVFIAINVAKTSLRNLLSTYRHQSPFLYCSLLHHHLLTFPFYQRNNTFIFDIPSSFGIWSIQNTHSFNLMYEWRTFLVCMQILKLYYNLFQWLSQAVKMADVTRRNPYRWYSCKLKNLEALTALWKHSLLCSLCKISKSPTHHNPQLVSAPSLGVLSLRTEWEARSQ